MYLAYVDESGVPHEGSTEGKFFVLSAVIAHNTCWHRINCKAIEIKSKYFPTKNPNRLEFRMYDILHSKKQYQQANKKTKDDYLQEIFSLFSNTDLTVVSTVVKKKEWSKKHPNLNVGKTCWTNLLEQIEMFLVKKMENGLLVMDSQNPREDGKIRRHVESVIRKGAPRTTIDHIIEDIFFTRSEIRNLTQLADAAAFCTRQHMRNNTDNAPYWKMLEPRLHRDSQGNYDKVGLRVVD